MRAPCRRERKSAVARPCRDTSQTGKKDQENAQADVGKRDHGPTKLEGGRVIFVDTVNRDREAGKDDHGEDAPAHPPLTLTTMSHHPDEHQHRQDNKTSENQLFARHRFGRKRDRGEQAAGRADCESMEKFGVRPRLGNEN